MDGMKEKREAEEKKGEAEFIYGGDPPCVAVLSVGPYPARLLLLVHFAVAGPGLWLGNTNSSTGLPYYWLAGLQPSSWSLVMVDG